MKLHSPAFEKRLRSAVKAAVRSSPALAREYKAAKSARAKRYHIRLLYLASLGSGLVVRGAVHATGNPIAGLAVINLWILLMCSVMAPKLLEFVFRSKDRPALVLLPVSNSVMFRWNLRSFFWKYAFPAALGACSAFAALGIYFEFSAGQWVGLAAVGALSWVMLLALTVHGAARLPVVLFQGITVGFVLIGGMVYFGMNWIGPAVLEWFNRAAPTLNLVLPTGWSPCLATLALPEGNWITGWLLVPVGIILVTAKWSLQLLGNRSGIRESVSSEPNDQLMQVEPSKVAADKMLSPAAVMRSEIEDIEENIRSRQFLAHGQWKNRGPLESWFWRWLNPREKILADFAFPNGIHTTSAWKWIFGVGAATVLIELAVSSAESWKTWPIASGGVVLICFFVVQLFAGAPFRVVSSGGVSVPIYAAFPVGYRELSGVLVKHSAVQLPLLIPFLSACAVFVAYQLGENWVIGIQFGIKLALLLFALRLIAAALSFSANTNDSSIRRLRVPGLFIGMGLLFFGLGAGGLFVPNPWIAWLLSALALCAAYLLFFLYGRIFDSYRFDLMKLQPGP